MTEGQLEIPSLGIDDACVNKAFEDAEGDVFEFANLLAKQVGPLDDEDEILPEQIVSDDDDSNTKNW
ncbi:hypothetical protein EHI8A_027700 [Entamoeba histolytica HM-1:IMSS-B]|uniref:Uncharacterized protein n=4 Tax=Entamoeba histolytica TaxID=5759 RepID=A0A175JKV2_ENTHI|nr:hypothetical protein EHI8A_027700 [Entamoeba histolytica HM-1:IMSS-B]EMS17229.1 hypothetical protein KM1_052360 [Entamoeba histolytica HM-3:IMSS]ENY62136.1 unknown protein, putative [Entamoeba histolytica HM-1:IMSS-A]GAT94331.1 hypothetical protein CL6EHI_c00082 [Entamoeba histolytica]